MSIKYQVSSIEVLIVGGHPVQSRATLLQFANTVTMYSLRAGVRLNAA